MKFVDVRVTFSEVPDEISLCINLSGCPIRCPDCHSKYLWEDVGEELSEQVLSNLLQRNVGISCICLMGGSEQDLSEFLRMVRNVSDSTLKVAWYTGGDKLPSPEVSVKLDYVKIGPYRDTLGPLTSRVTNQRFYKIQHIPDSQAIFFEDITSRFWREEEI